MSEYRPPVQDMLFLLFDVLGFDQPDLDRDTAASILDEAAKLAAGTLAPLNKTGDRAGALWAEGSVKTAPGFKDAYRHYCAGGWNAVPFPAQYGGQGLPWALAFPIQEMWQGANMAFGLCPLLNQGAVEAILSHGSEAQKDFYLPKLIEGVWTGTMNLTEPQAGSDLGLIKTKAVRNGDAFKIFGQKIFITYGEHDLAENIIHLVLARIEGAPEDVKGISLFIVPKFLENGARNDVRCTGIEHKLGIHASPTCTMQFGDEGGATGYLVGRENEGLKYMFTMMNNARLSVGLQGVAIAEAAYQHAAAYAAQRVQGKSFSSSARVTIDQHADIKRMLLTMQAMIHAGRAMTYEAAMALDAAHAGDAAARMKVDILTPIVKAWCTDMACEVASMGVQVHGGMGYIEETGAAQFYRDARILPIYEGTNGIQALDLVFRKMLRDEGQAFSAWIESLRQRTPQPRQNALFPYFDRLLQGKDFILSCGRENNMDGAAAAATSFLKAAGIVAGAVSLCDAAQKAGHVSGAFGASFMQDKQMDADTFLKQILPFAGALLAAAAG